MNSLNIESLFPSDDTDERLPTKGKLDIDSLFADTITHDDPSKIFDSSSLFKNIYSRRAKQKMHCIKMYANCTDRIKSADALGIKDIIYVLPDVIPECPHFSHKECLLYIQTNLRQEYLDTLILNDRRIFISWKNIEKNKEEKQKEQDK